MPLFPIRRRSEAGRESAPASVVAGGELSDHKKVLIFGVIFGYGGLECHFLDLDKLLVENDAEVTFATRVANPDVLKMPVWREAPFKVLTTPNSKRTHYQAST
jgi:hypothetical protein